MRRVVICMAVPITTLLALTLLIPLGWAQGFPATEMARSASTSGRTTVGGPVDTPPQRSDGGLLYLTSLDLGDGTFAVYDPGSNSWATLTSYDTGCQMAVDTAGNLYAYRSSPPQIDVYDPGSDTWSYVMDAPPGTSGQYCNLEVTREGEFLYTESYGTAVHYTQGGTWHTVSVPFMTNAMGDYDPATDQYVIGQALTLYAHLIDLTTWTITDFVNGAGGNGEYARFSSVMDGRYYCQAVDDIYSYDLTSPSSPAQNHGYPGFYPSSAADRANQVIYVASLDGSQLQLFDPAAGTMTPLAPSGVSTWHSSLAFAAPTSPAGQVIASWPSGLVAAWGVAFDGLDNMVWVSSPGVNWGGTATMYEYTPAGAPTGRAHPYSWGPDNGPADITFSWNTKTIWVMNIAQGASNCLYEMDPATGFTGQTICPGGPAGWTNSQRGVAFDPTTDTFYAGGWNEGIVYHVDMAGNDVEPPVNVGLPISGLAYNPDTQHLFAMVNSTTTEIFVLDAAAGYMVVGQFAVSQDFGDYAGAGLEIDCEGKLWAVDQNLEGVYRIESGETASFCVSIFADGFESADTSAWSATVP